MQEAANKVLLVHVGSMKDLINKEMKNMKRETARPSQLRLKLNTEET